MDASAQLFVKSASLWRDCATTVPSIEAVQAFLISIYRSPYGYSAVLPLFIEELKVHVTTRVIITDSATIEKVRNLLDFLVKDASGVATSLTINISDILHEVEAGYKKVSNEVNTITNTSSLADGAVAVTNVVETVAETTGTIAKDIGQTAAKVHEVIDDVHDAVNSAGLGGTMLGDAVHVIQTGEKIVSDVVQKTDVVVQRVDEIAERAEVIVRSNAQLIQRLQRYLCCCKKSG